MLTHLNDSINEFDSASGAAAPRPGKAESPAPASPEPAREARASELLDAEMLDVVQKFEQNFADLAPRATDAPAAAFADDPIFDIPDDFLREPSPAPRVDPAREPVTARTAARGRVEPGLRKAADESVSYEDALALLQASEAKGRRAAAPEREPLDDDDDEPVAKPPLPTYERARPSAPPRAPAVDLSRPAANESWSIRPGAVWPKVAIAALVALAVGAGAGFFFAGKADGPHASAAKIETTAQGGAQLKLDQELTPRK